MARRNKNLKYISSLVTFLILCGCSGSTYETTVTPEKKLVVAFGDSQTIGGNPDRAGNNGFHGYVPYLQASLGLEYLVLNCGIGGDTSLDLVTRGVGILKGDYTDCSERYDYSAYNGLLPDIMLVMIGTNDVLQGFGLRVLEANIIDLVALAQDSGTEIFLSTIPIFSMAVPEDINAVNLVIDGVARVYDVPLVDGGGALSAVWGDISWDGLHFSYEGYQILSDLWSDILRG